MIWCFCFSFCIGHILGTLMSVLFGTILRVLSDPADQFKSIFLFCTCSCVLDCNLLCYIIVNKSLFFQSNLKTQRTFFYFILFLLTSVLHWLKISCLYVAFDSSLLQEWLFYCFSLTPFAVWRLWQPHKPWRYWQNMSAWLLSIVSLFLFLTQIMFCCHRKVWNVQYRILQSMQAKNCGTLFSVYGICKCTGRNYLYFSNVISLIWDEQYYSYQNLTNNAKIEFDFFHIDINGQIWLFMGSKLTTRAFYIQLGWMKSNLRLSKIILMATQWVLCFLLINVENDSIFSKTKWSTTTIFLPYMVVEMLRAFS